jgi:predicted metal-dependent enzyme (double-stranded beta helix superfamily)
LNGSAEGEIRTRRHVYASLAYLFDELRRLHNACCPANVQAVRRAVQSLEFNEKEWQGYAFFSQENYTRNWIANTPDFSILLLCWEPGQKSPVHDHTSSNAWLKVKLWDCVNPFFLA